MTSDTVIYIIMTACWVGMIGFIIWMLFDLWRMRQADKRRKAIMTSSGDLIRKAISATSIHDQGEPTLKPSDLSAEAIGLRAWTELRSDEDWQFVLTNTQRWIDGTDQILNGMTWEAEVVAPERSARETQARLERRNGMGPGPMAARRRELESDHRPITSDLNIFTGM